MNSSFKFSLLEIIQMKKIVLALSLFLFSFLSEAQQSIKDSSRVLQLISDHFMDAWDDPELTLIYADSAIALSKKINYPRGEAIGYYMKGNCYHVKGDFAKSLFCYQQEMDIYKELKDEHGQADASYSLGDMYFELGDYKQALHYIYLYNAYINSLPDSIYNYITNTWESKKLVLLYSDKALSQIHLAANSFDSALFYGLRALKVDRELKLSWSGLPVLLGNIYEKMNRDSEALVTYNIVTTRNSLVDETDINIGRATVFKKLNEIDSCRYYAKLALDTAQIRHYTKQVMRASELLAFAYEQSNSKESIKYFKIANAVKDSLYGKEKINQSNSFLLNNQLRQRDAEAAEIKYNNQKKIFLLLAVSVIFLVAGILLLRNIQHKKRSNILLQFEKEKVEKTLNELQSTQAQLIQSEKMASLGELTAGIAHEIQNPLNFVNNFSEVNKEMIAEMKEEIHKGNYDEAKLIANDLEENEEKINHHGKRADAIVKGMLQHSKTSSGQKELTDINKLADEYLRLSYHGIRAKDKEFNATMKTDFDESIGNINIIPQDIGRLLLNLYNNAFYAVNERKKQQAENYEPTVSIKTKKLDGKIEISVKDNGNGIPQKVVDKIFQPFFTTKPTGQGTGLGLSLSYDIVKAHGGEIKVESKEGEGSTFIIQLNC
jgi:two-component system NtrC family sensor kinase